MQNAKNKTAIKLGKHSILNNEQISVKIFGVLLVGAARE